MNFWKEKVIANSDSLVSACFLTTDGKELETWIGHDPGIPRDLVYPVEGMATSERSWYERRDDARGLAIDGGQKPVQVLTGIVELQCDNDDEKAFEMDAKSILQCDFKDGHVERVPVSFVIEKTKLVRKLQRTIEYPIVVLVYSVTAFFFPLISSGAVGFCFVIALLAAFVSFSIFGYRKRKKSLSDFRAKNAEIDERWFYGHKVERECQ